MEYDNRAKHGVMRRNGLCRKAILMNENFKTLKRYKYVRILTIYGEGRGQTRGVKQDNTNIFNIKYFDIYDVKYMRIYYDF